MNHQKIVIKTKSRKTKVQDQQFIPPNEADQKDQNSGITSITQGKWSIEQKKKYNEFLIKYSKFFDNQMIRRRKKVFKKLQKWMGTKNAKQCKSHHQKMIFAYKDIDGILQNCKNKDRKNKKMSFLIEKIGNQPQKIDNMEEYQFKEQSKENRQRINFNESLFDVLINFQSTKLQQSMRSTQEKQNKN